MYLLIIYKISLSYNVNFLQVNQVLHHFEYMNLPVGLLLTEKKQNKARTKINGPDKVIVIS